MPLPIGFKHSEESKEKMRLSKMGDKNPRWGGDNVQAQAGRLRAERKFKNIPDNCERHHIDGNTLNNDPSNIAIVTRKEHMVSDGRLEKLKILDTTDEYRERARLMGKANKGRSRISRRVK